MKNIISIGKRLSLYTIVLLSVACGKIKNAAVYEDQKSSFAYPHSSTWAASTEHGLYVTIKGETECATCHGANRAGGNSGVSCNACHGNHDGGGAGVAPTSCVGCHESMRPSVASGHPQTLDCKMCHSPSAGSFGVHPSTWANIDNPDDATLNLHKAAVIATGITYCKKCHGNGTTTSSMFDDKCSECHDSVGTGGFNSIHKTQTTNGTTCILCHEDMRPSTTTGSGSHALASSQDCASCHSYNKGTTTDDGSFEIPKGQQESFAESGHANKESKVWIGHNSGSCSRCHSPEGQKDYIGADETWLGAGSRKCEGPYGTYMGPVGCTSQATCCENYQNLDSDYYVYTNANITVADKTITIANHGFETGDVVAFTASGIGGAAGTLPTGVGATSYIIWVDDNRFKLASSYANAFVPTPLTLTADGTGTQFLKFSPAFLDGDVNATTDTIAIAGHPFKTGAPVLVTSSNATPPAGLIHAQFVDADVSGSTIAIADHSLFSGYRVSLSSTGVLPTGLMKTVSSVDASANTLTFAAPHSFVTGDVVKITSSTTVPAGLGTSAYYVIYVSDTVIKLAATPQWAIDNNPIDITNTGTGTHKIYYSTVFVVNTGSSTIQLAASYAKAVATPPVPIDLGTAAGGGTHKLTFSSLYAIKAGANSLQLATSLENANANTVYDIPASAATSVGTYTIKQTFLSVAPEYNHLDCTTCHNSKTADYVSTGQVVTFTSGLTSATFAREGMCVRCHALRTGESALRVTAAIVGAATSDSKITTGTYTYAQWPQNTATAVGGVLASASKNKGLSPHNRPATAILMGNDAQVGYQYSTEFPTRSYSGKNIHTSGAATCIDCHNPHSTAVETAKCATCHRQVTAGVESTLENIRNGSTPDYDGDGNTTEGIYSEVEGVKAKLNSAIVAYGALQSTPLYFVSPFDDGGDSMKYVIDAGGNSGTTSVADGSYTPRLLKATWNYQLIAKEFGAYAHNPRYAIQLMYDGLEDLNTGITAYLTTFAGSTAAARSFDDSVIASNVITKAAHGFVRGAAVKFTQGSAPITGLTDQATYYVIWLSSSTFSLASTIENAIAGTAKTLTPGVATAHSLNYTTVPTSAMVRPTP